MSFFVSRKKYKFNVDLTLEELNNVSFVSAVVFAKLRLLQGGNFCETSSSEEVKSHTVKWTNRFKFVAKMTANSQTGELDPCICRVSVRKEAKGGRSFHKLGFVDINLPEFAGDGLTSRRYLLEGYDSRSRQDNSVLRVSIQLTLLAGDPCFKTPSTQYVSIPGEAEANSDKPNPDLVTSGDSAFSNSTPELAIDDPTSQLPGHSRNNSNQSAGYGSLSQSQHSRQSSNQSETSRQSNQSSIESGHARQLSNGSSRGTSSENNTAERSKRKKEESRVENTRVSADSVVESLMQHLNINSSGIQESTGLQLYVTKDGSTVLGGQELTNKSSGSSFLPVVMEHEKR